MTHEETKAMVEKLKTTWTAFGGLSKGEQEFLKKHINDCVWVSYGGTTFISKLTKHTNGTIYLLSPDFVLPEPEKERWFYSPYSHIISKVGTFITGEPPATAKWFISAGYIEIPSEDVDYVRKCIELHKAGKVNLDEFELKLVRFGENCDYLSIAQPNNRNVEKYLYSDGLRFVRKQTAEPVLKQVELEVVHSRQMKSGISKDSMQVNLDGWKPVSEAWLYAINRGMGPEFQFDNDDYWYSFPIDIDTDTGKPAKLVKMRVWVKEEVK